MMGKVVVQIFLFSSSRGWNVGCSVFGSSKCTTDKDECLLSNNKSLNLPFSGPEWFGGQFKITEE